MITLHLGVLPDFFRRFSFNSALFIQGPMIPDYDGSFFYPFPMPSVDHFFFFEPYKHIFTLSHE